MTAPGHSAPEPERASVPLLRHKHRYRFQGVEELAIPRDQTTLEKFAP